MTGEWVGVGTRREVLLDLGAEDVVEPAEQRGGNRPAQDAEALLLVLRAVRVVHDAATLFD